MSQKIDQIDYKYIKKDAMSIDITNNRNIVTINGNAISMPLKFYATVNSVKFSYEHGPNCINQKQVNVDRIEIFLEDVYIWVHPKERTFEVMAYGD